MGAQRLIITAAINAARHQIGCMGDNRIISMNAAIIVGISGSISPETALVSSGVFFIILIVVYYKY